MKSDRSLVNNSDECLSDQEEDLSCMRDRSRRELSWYSSLKYDRNPKNLEVLKSYYKGQERILILSCRGRLSDVWSEA